MIVGRQSPGPTPLVLAADTKYVTRYFFPEAGFLPKLTVYVTGRGGGLSAQVARGIVYDVTTDELLAEGVEVVVEHGQAPGWVDFSFANLPGGCVIPKPGAYDLGIHAGPASGTIEVYV